MMESGKKEETHTMERPAGIEEEETDDNNQKLYQILKNLEQEWNFIKKRPEETLYRSSTGSSKMIKALGLLDKSPRKLMSSLQHRIISPPPSEEVAWKVRTNDLAVDEILNERRAAIASGKLKGRRRLFEELEGVISTDQEISLVQESDVRSVFSYDYSDNYEEENWGRKEALYPSCPHCSYSSSSSSSSSTSLCAENVERGGLEVATMAEKRTNIGCDIVGSGRGRGRSWLVISLIVVCIVGMIISRNCFGIYEDEEVILTPT